MSSSTLNIGDTRCNPGVRRVGSPLTMIGPLPLGSFQTYCGPSRTSWNETPAAIGAEVPDGVELTMLVVSDGASEFALAVRSCGTEIEAWISRVSRMIPSRASSCAELTAVFLAYSTTPDLNTSMNTIPRIAMIIVATTISAAVKPPCLSVVRGRFFIGRLCALCPSTRCNLCCDRYNSPSQWRGEY